MFSERNYKLYIINYGAPIATRTKSKSTCVHVQCTLYAQSNMKFYGYNTVDSATTFGRWYYYHGSP